MLKTNCKILYNNNKKKHLSSLNKYTSKIDKVYDCLLKTAMKIPLCTNSHICLR